MADCINESIALCLRDLLGRDLSIVDRGLSGRAASPEKDFSFAWSVRDRVCVCADVDALVEESIFLMLW